WYNTINDLLNVPSYNGDYPFVGETLWGYTEGVNLNQGFVSLHDNLYDGVQSCAATGGQDIFGFPTGGESMPPAWAANTTYGGANLSGPTLPAAIAVTVSGTEYIFSNLGNSAEGGSTAPNWSSALTPGQTVVDNLVTWTDIGAHTNPQCTNNDMAGVAAGNALWLTGVAPPTSLQVTGSVTISGGVIIQ
ncbi:MAG: hypothetical protein WCA77_06265, partial [Thermoplasmata archaeon]